MSSQKDSLLVYFILMSAKSSFLFGDLHIESLGLAIEAIQRLMEALGMKLWEPTTSFKVFEKGAVIKQDIMNKAFEFGIQIGKQAE